MIGTAIVVLAALCATTTAAIAGAARPPGARPLAGRYYDATGKQALEFAFKTSASGRQLTATAAGGYQLDCTAGSTKSRQGSLPDIDAGAGSGSISKDGAFKLSLPVHGQPAIKLVGRFVTKTKVNGTLSWHGTGGRERGCVVNTDWAGNVRPLNDYFVGRTSTGATVTLAVALGATPTISDFSVGGVQATCSSPPNNAVMDGGLPAMSTNTDTTGTSTAPAGSMPGSMPEIVNGYVGAVHGGQFHAQTEDSDGNAFTVSGTLSGKTVSGTVDENSREGCSYSGISWSAAYVRRGV
jgi:hypothetical protein